MGDKSSTFGKLAAALCCDGARPRERIVTTARDMFHRHGIRGIGVEAIAEAAGTNKMTLYRHFGSKDELVLECLQKAAADGLAQWDRLEADFPGDPMGQLQAWLRRAAESVADEQRGCELANAAMELGEPDHPARRLIGACKAGLRDRLAAVCRAAGIAQPDLLADTLSLLLEGARVSRQSVGSDGPSATFVHMGEAVIASFVKR